ncbi:serine-rich adhesin for platelets-like [Hoplias malabaricus]|uniref:serine-rich adhesin for platelets-like n=1 Tax=Hoplias malabaricus TaxID=27720 RepID=UPI003462E1F9
MSPLPSPPTMSITEEIMQFINQNCVREGMAELSCDMFVHKSEPLDVQVTDPQDIYEHQLVQEDDQQKSDSNTPEDKQTSSDLTLDKEDDSGHSPLSDLTANFPSEVSSSSPSNMSKNMCQMEETTPIVCNQSDPSEPVILVPEEAESKAAEDNIIMDEIPNATNGKEENIKESSAETMPLCDHSSTTKPAEKQQAPKSEADEKLTKSDKQIIEKIRSYYEAAESETVVEEGQLTRRNSFSQIPTGLVKDSVLRFNFVHQDSLCDSESGRSDYNEGENMTPPLSMTEQKIKTLSQPEPNSGAHELPHSDQGQIQGESKCNEDEGDQICDFKPCMQLWKEKEGQADNPKASPCKGSNFADGKDTCSIEPCSINDKIQVLHKQPLQDHKEIIEPKCLLETKNASKTSSTRLGDRISSNENLDALPSQIKLGRLSRHGKVVACSRTLYEGMADVPGLGFFEGVPVDQCLVENSEKILSKVQMLARMYTAKASSMKVPLHQKRTRGPWVAPSKLNTPPKSELKLHQADVKTQNQLADDQMESVVPSMHEPFGHVFLREQLSKTYHQDNDCNLSGQKEQVEVLQSSATESNSLECFTASTEISSGTTEEKLAEDLKDVMISRTSLESSVQKYELGCTDQALPSKEDHYTSPPPICESQTQDVPETSFDQCEFLPEQKTNHSLYSITEDQPLAAERPLSAGDKPIMPCHSDTKDEQVIDPVAAQCLKEESNSTEEKHSPSLNSCEYILCSEEMVCEAQLETSVHSSDYPIPSMMDCTNKITQSSVDGVDGTEESFPIVSVSYATSASETTNNSQPQMEDPEQSYSSQLQPQSSHTPSTTNVPSPLTPLDMHNLEPLKGKETPNNGLPGLSPSSTPPPCGSATDNLPKFTSQRPDNLPTTMGRKSFPANWDTPNPSSSQRVPLPQPWSREQHQETSSSASLAPSNIQSFSKKSSSIPVDSCFSETKRPSAFSSSLRMRSPSPVRSSPHLSSSTSALAKSLAASCISQTISQSMAKRNTRNQATTPPTSSSPSPASTLRLRSPSPKTITLDSCVASDTGSISPAGIGNQNPHCPISPFHSSSLRSSPASVQSPPPYHSHQSMSPPITNSHSVSSGSHTRLDHLEQSSLNGNNNNNNSICSNGWSSSHKKPSVLNMGVAPHHHGGATHNRVARPFLSSEPNSRVQSPSASPSPSSFSRICSPPLIQNNAALLTTKPPNPRTPRQSVTSPFTPLCLEFSRPNSTCSLSPCASPRVTSPPPIGIPTTVLCIASPQPRNPTVTPSSPTRVEASSTSRGSRILSPLSGVSPCLASCSSSSQNHRKQRGSSLPFVKLSGRPPSPSGNEHRSWADNGHWSVDIESDMTSPCEHSYNGTPVCVSPGLQSPVRLTVRKTSQGETHLTSNAWPDMHELLTKYKTENNTECDILPSSPCSETGLDDSELGKPTCRTSLICAYVARAPPVSEPDIANQCSEEGQTEDSVPVQGKKPLKTSYATTVNLHIAGSGRITSFSNAQVSLTQTLAPVTDTQGMRRVSINSCNLSLQNCKRL